MAHYLYIFCLLMPRIQAATLAHDNKILVIGLAHTIGGIAKHRLLGVRRDIVIAIQGLIVLK